MLIRSFAVGVICLIPVSASAIISGTPPTDAGWESTLFLRTRATCSATLIGPRVLVTAASCVPDGQEAMLTRNDISIKCDRHPEYQPGKISDVALCMLDVELATVRSERISAISDRRSLGERVLLAGYGCRKKGGFDRQLGELLVGEAYLPKNTFNARSYLLVTGAALCRGDAGGGTYGFIDGKSNQRQLIGVNASSDVSEKSNIWPIATAEFLDWAKAWSAKYDVRICGIEESACRVGGGLSATPDEASVIALSSSLEGASIASAAATASIVGVSLQQVINVNVRKNDIVRDLAVGLCGDPSEEYFREFEEYHSKTGTSFARDTRFVADAVVDFPTCLPSLSRDRITVQVKPPLNSAWRIFDDLGKKRLVQNWKGFRNAGAPLVANETSEYFLEALAAANKNVDVEALPVGQLEVPLRPKQVVARFVDALVPPSVEPVFSFQSALASCTVPEDRSHYPFSLELLLDVLRLNRRANALPLRSPVGVIIADSGLYGVGRGVFSKSVLLNTKDALDPSSVLSGSAALHGTEVASVVLGGPFFARFNAISSVPRVQIGMVPIYRMYSVPGGGTRWIGAKEGMYEAAIKLAADTDSKIINLSIKTAGELSALVNELRESSNYLFVVAAGNSLNTSQVQLGVGGSSNIYPAMHGGSGRGAHNLLTVTSLDWDKKAGNLRVADFAFRGSEWVEIAAPGCNVPTISYDAGERKWTVVERSGTSFSAPLVSFAAALVKSERGPGGATSSLKRRVLISADLQPDLESSVRDGRVLNIAKAVAIDHDVVELVGTKQLIVGTLQFVLDGEVLSDNASLNLSCRGISGTANLAISDLLKIRPGFRMLDGKSFAKIYQRAPEAVTTLFRNLECELPSTLSIVIHDEQKDVDQHYSLNEIVDIVRRD